MRKINRMTIRYLLDTFSNYRIINKSIYNIDGFINISLDLVESRLEKITYKYRQVKIEVDHNNSKIVISEVNKE